MRRLSALILAGAMILAGCSGEGVKITEPTTTLFPPTTTVVETTPTVVTTTIVDTPSVETTTTIPVPTTTYALHALEFVPEVDSFSFENFGGGEAPADLTVNMARRLYGDNQVCSDVTDNKCTPYPVILQLIQQANKSMQGGLCEGLAVLSLRLAGDLKTLASYQGTDTVAQLIKEDPALLSEIAYWYVTQFAIEVQQEASRYLEMSPRDLAEVLMYDFAQSEAGESYTGFTLGIYSDHGGHALTPYKVEQVSDGYRIYVYDSNWPNVERWISVDDDGWSYALASTNPNEESSAWSGGVGTMELTPMRIRSGPFTCGFCPTEGSEKSGTLLTVAASGDKQMSLKIVTESGQRLGYYEEGFVNEIPGATYRYLISGPTTADPVLVFLPADVEAFSADVEEIDVSDVEEEVIEEEVKPQKFSLLVLNEEKSVQIEAVVKEEPDEVVEEEGVVVEEQSLLAFSEESIEIAEIEEATVAIAIDALEVEIDLERGQQIEVTFDVVQPPTDTEAVVREEPQMMAISIADEVGEVLAEVEVDVSLYRVVTRVEEPVTTVPNQPDVTVPAPEPVIVPVIIEISYNEEVGEIVQEEEVIEAWVASDAEYFQAVADDNLAEVVGESWAEEIEEVIAWEPAEEDSFDLTAVLLSVDEEYWEDEQWEEVVYDDEYFEEVEEEFEELYSEGVELEDVYEFIEEIEEEQELILLEIEEYWEEHDEEVLEVDNETDTDWTLEEDWSDEDWVEEEDFDVFEDDFWLDTDEEWEEWQEEFWDEDAEWCDECEAGPWDDENWDEPWEEEEEVWEDDWEELTEEWTDEEWDDWDEFVEGEEEWYDEEWEDEYEEGYEEPDEDWDETGWGDAEPEGEEEDEWLEGSEEEVEEVEEEVEEELEDEWEDEWLDDDESESDGSISDEEEVDEEQVDETELPLGEEDEDEWEEEWEEAIDEEEWEEEWEEESAEILEEIEEELEEDIHVEVEEEPELSWDPYDGCRDTPACADAPGGFTTWEAYDAANDPTYYDDLGEPPGGYETWQIFIVDVEEGNVDADVAAEILPEEMAEEFIPPPPPVYVPTYTTTNAAVSLQETISTSTVTAQTGTATTTNVTTDESGILTQNTNDGHWHLDTTTETTTATTVTNTLVDTTTVVARTGIDFVSCIFIDGTQSGCSTQRTWNDNETTATAGDAYTQASTTTVVSSATVNTEEGCAEGGWRGMGDWCMVTSGGRNDHDMIQFSLEETTNVRIDAETNLTYAQFVAGNHEYGDPYIYLNNDNDSDEGDHSADESAITVGSSIEADDDGGRQCDDIGGWSACINPPSSATDPDETPNITYCSSGGACSNGVPVIDNVSDVWDSEIIRTDLAPGDYVVRASVYNGSHDGWYRLTIEEDE